MPDPTSPTLAATLEELEIEDHPDLFELSRSKLRKEFIFPHSEKNNFDFARFHRNLIWQDLERLRDGTLELEPGNIRSYWYARSKPVLARAQARNREDKYDSLIDQLTEMVVDRRLFDYRDFGFIDEGRHNRRLGRANGHVLCVAEKAGHWPLLEKLHVDYDCTIVALGGAPSALSSEYLLAELIEAGVNISGPVPVLTIVDYDPSGNIIANAFIDQLEALGFPGELQRLDLVHPSRMTARQIRLNKYAFSRKGREKAKGDKWTEETGGLSAYGHEARRGLQADAMRWEQMEAAFEELATPYLAVPKAEVVRRRLKRELLEVMRDLLLVRLGVG